MAPLWGRWYAVTTIYGILDRANDIRQGLSKKSVVVMAFWPNVYIKLCLNCSQENLKNVLINSFITLIIRNNLMTLKIAILNHKSTFISNNNSKKKIRARFITYYRKPLASIPKYPDLIKCLNHRSGLDYLLPYIQLRSCLRKKQRQS